MTPKEKKWTQLIAWVNNNTCFSGKDVLEVIRALEDSSKCEPSDRECSSCQFHIEDGICGITKKPIWGRCGLWQTNSKSCKCIDYDVTKICLTCLHRVTVGHEPYCDDPNSGWGYHGKILRCERWQEKDQDSNHLCVTCRFLRKPDRWCNYHCLWVYSGVDAGCSCSTWQSISNESIDAASSLKSLLIKQVTELQAKVQDLSLQLDIMKLDYPPKSPSGGRRVKF